MLLQSHQPPSNLFIFKTNIESQNQIKAIHQIFKTHQSIKDWWVDTDDIDSVMRVEVNNHFSENEIIAIVNKIGFVCDILDY